MPFLVVAVAGLLLYVIGVPLMMMFRVRKVLQRIQAGQIDVSQRRSVVDSVRARRHAFRGGGQTEAAKAAGATSKEKAEELLAKLQDELATAVAQKSKPKKKRKNKTDPFGYKGKQVSVPATYWHMPEEHSAFVGVVGKYTKWKCKGEQKEGHEIRFEDGVEKLPLADFVPYLVPV